MSTTTPKFAPADDYLQLVQKFPLTPIRSQKQLKEAHGVIDRLTQIPEHRLTQGQADYLEVLGDLALKFESPQVDASLSDLTGLDILNHLLQEHGMNASELGRLLGQRELGSKILRGDRQISRSHAQALGTHFGLPPETFLR